MYACSEFSPQPWTLDYLYIYCIYFQQIRDYFKRNHIKKFPLDLKVIKYFLQLLLFDFIPFQRVCASWNAQLMLEHRTWRSSGQWSWPVLGRFIPLDWSAKNLECDGMQSFLTNATVECSNLRTDLHDKHIWEKSPCKSGEKHPFHEKTKFWWHVSRLSWGRWLPDRRQ